MDFRALVKQPEEGNVFQAQLCAGEASCIKEGWRERRVMARAAEGELSQELLLGIETVPPEGDSGSLQFSGVAGNYYCASQGSLLLWNSNK